jgi:trehalose synthase
VVDAVDEQAYVDWLREQSMLEAAGTLAGRFSATAGMSHNPFAIPNPRAAIEKASVWFTAYPLSMITRPGCSFLTALGDPGLWDTFEAVGIDAVHTGPVKRAGGLSGVEATPSVDGYFDRISTDIDEAFGTEEEFRHLCEVAARHGAAVIDDIVPGHTGKGADFRLAEMNIGDYPGIYHMVEIPPEDWHLLPEVPVGKDSVNLSREAEDRLMRAGYIIGRLQRVIFYEAGVKETNWSATAPVRGLDGVHRRWVYLHYFKEGQPSINWLDPTFAGMRLVIGDALHSLGHLGTTGLRLDANGFLGLERARQDGAPAWSEGHPLSEAVNQVIAGLVRKLGGFTFQELNLAVDDIRTTSRRGADLSYDFLNRPACHHALATGDTEFLRLTLNIGLQYGVQPVSLVHALQNHDELTYELVHFTARHADDVFHFRREELTGGQLADLIRSELTQLLTGPTAPYNAIFTTNGISSTTATVITASLGYQDLEHLTPEQVQEIKRAHLLLASFNAWQPGVFALSGWDLCGTLTLEPTVVAELIADGDTRWIHRGAYDLMNYRPEGGESVSSLPRGRCLYGPLPAQLADPTSFASQLRQVLAVRRRYGIATGTQLDIAKTSSSSLLAMIHELDGGRIQATLLNFSASPIVGDVTSESLQPGALVTNMSTGKAIGRVHRDHSIPVTLRPHEALSVLLEG